MPIPKKITPCPINEAIVEIRFEANVLPDAVFGIIYNRFKEQYPNIDKLPILNLPEQVRINDALLRDKAWYKLKDENFIFMIGPRVVSIIKPKEYSGWKLFSARIQDSFNNLNELKIIKAVERIGIRYINFFDFDIFDKINLQINMNRDLLKTDETLLKVRIGEGRFTNTLQIANNVTIIHDSQQKSGSIIDIDTVAGNDRENFFEESAELLKEGHDVEKELFFRLLKEDFLASLKPEY